MEKMKILSLGCAALMLIVAGSSFAQDRSYINPRNAADSNVPPFSGAVQTGDTLYISGMIGLVNGQVPDSAAEEARVLLDSIKSTVEEAGMTMDDLVYVQIFSSDVADYDAFNSVYRTYFTQEYPARAFIGVGTLLFNARFEMQSIAVRR